MAVGVTAGGLAGCVGSFSGDGSDLGDVVDVGVFTTYDFALGNSLRLGAQVAAAEINNNGGIAGADVELTSKDTQGDPATGRSVYQELTTGQNVDVTIGSWSSEVLINTMPLLPQTQTIHLSAGASSDEPSRMVAENYEDYKYYFRPGPVNSVHLGEFLADLADDFLVEEGLTNVAFLVEDFAWTDPLHNAMKANMSSEINVVSDTVFSGDIEDFTSIFDEIENKGADVALGIMAFRSTPVTVQWFSQKRQFGLLGFLNSVQPGTAFENLDGACEFTGTWATAVDGSNNTPKTQPFIDAYKQQHNQSPLYAGLAAYDSLYVFKEAVEEAETLDSEELIPVIEEMSYTGTQGQIEFYGPDAEFPHDLVYDPDQVPQLEIQWQSEGGTGSREVIWPTDLATSDYQSPSWI